MTLQELLAAPDAQRNEHWESQLLAQIPDATLELFSPDPQLGPDNWPYLMAKIADHGGGEPCRQVLHWLSEKGIGLVINPQKNYPDAVISYGMAWGYRHRGHLKFESEQLKSDKIEMAPGQKIYTRPPDETYMPEYARKIIRQFLTEQGVPQPKVLLISEDRKNEDLCFSLKSLGNPPEKEHQGILEALSWFLPTDYTVGLIDDTGLPEFAPL